MSFDKNLKNNLSDKEGKMLNQIVNIASGM